MGREGDALTETGRGRRLQVSIIRGLAFGRKDTGNFSARVMCTVGKAEKMNSAVHLHMTLEHMSMNCTSPLTYGAFPINTLEKFLEICDNLKNMHANYMA